MAFHVTREVMAKLKSLPPDKEVIERMLTELSFNERQAKTIAYHYLAGTLRAADLPTIIEIWFCPHCGNGKSRFFAEQLRCCPVCGYGVNYWGTMVIPEQKEEYPYEQGG